MEFTVSKADLVRELNLSQGVVEKKTTIPILSNVLLETDGDRIYADGDRSGTGNPLCSCPARGKKQGAGTIPARRLLDYVRLLPDADIQVKFGDNQWANLVCGRSRTRIAGMSRESFPELPQMPEVLAEIPMGILAAMIQKTIFAISAEESRFTLNGALLMLKERRPGDGRDRRTPAGDGGSSSAAAVAGSRLSGRCCRRKAMQRNSEAVAGRALRGDLLRFSGDDNHLFFRDRRPLAAQPQADRELPGLRARASERSAEFRKSAAGRIAAAIERVAQFSDERSRAIRLQVLPGELKFIPLFPKPARAKRDPGRILTARKSRSDSMRSTCSIFCRRPRGERVAFHFRDPQSAGELRPSRRRRNGRLSVRHHADAHLTRIG